uniref:ATP synthase complex subunit 8 n=1 Tax=Chudania sinica TaxID=3237924 RepID=A0AB39A582_9HEMI
MPQMSPMWWMLLMMYFIVILIIFNSIIYFNLKYFMNKSNKYMFKNMNWKW